MREVSATGATAEQTRATLGSLVSQLDDTLRKTTADVTGALGALQAEVNAAIDATAARLDLRRETSPSPSPKPPSSRVVRGGAMEGGAQPRVWRGPALRSRFFGL